MATAAAMLASEGVAAATDVLSSDETIHGCYKQSNGQLRVVAPGTECRDTERALTWSQRGPAGPEGRLGERGVAGEKGEKGEKGDKGEAGPPGDAGERGELGPQGDKGDAGPQGDTGEKGARGPAGPQGETGPQGEKGDTGPQGPAGQDGAPGAAARGMDVRTVRIAPDGEPVEVPVLGGGRLVLAPWGGGFTCSIDYRNAGDTAQTLTNSLTAPVTVGAGTTRHLGQGYSKQTSPEDHSVLDEGGEHGAWFRVAATQQLAGDDGLACVYQVVVAA